MQARRGDGWPRPTLGGRGGEDEGDGAHRRPGRPRDPGYDKVILDATLEILNDKGYAGLTIDGVAARTGVGRPTIYRRWRSKPALVIAALTQSPRLLLTPEPVLFVTTCSPSNAIR